MNTVIEWAVNSVYTQGKWSVSTKLSRLHFLKINFFSDSEHSGAIDVIVVRRSDGTLYSSPFHVKIGSGCRRKLNSKADRDKGIVRLRRVSNSISPNNNEARYISMKLSIQSSCPLMSAGIKNQLQFIPRVNLLNLVQLQGTMYLATHWVEKSDFQPNSVTR